MKALYVTGATPISDVRPAQRLTQVAPDLAMTYVASVADALVEIRKNLGYQVLFTDPTLPQNETLALITSLRRDRAPVALVPVVAEEQRDFLASAVAAGADDVLLLQGEAVLHAAGTLLRIRHSPHLLPAENRPRLRLLYAGRDQLVWTLLEQIPFIKSERAMLGADGSCVVRVPGADTGRLRCDVVLIDEQPGDAHPLQVVKSIKSQASDLPVVVLTAANDLHTATAALDLGADEAVSKAGIYRRRLIATLRRLHQRVEMEALHSNVAARETRLRNIVERLPAAVTVISDDGRILAVNSTALSMLGAQQPSDLVGREFAHLVIETDRAMVEQAFEGIRRGQADAVRASLAREGQPRQVELRGVLLERDARGGRGVVAVMVPVDAAVAAVDPLVAQAPDLSELGALRAAQTEATQQIASFAAALDEAQQRHDVLERDLARERTAREAERADSAMFAAETQTQWEQERAALQTQLTGLGDSARGLDDLRAAHEAIQHRERGLLDDLGLLRSTAEAAASTYAEGQARWDAERSDLHARIASLEQTQQELAAVRAAHEAGGTREHDLADELAALRATADTAAAAHDQGRAWWEAERSELHGRIAWLEQAQQELATVRAAYEAGSAREQRLTEELAAARSAQEAAAAERNEWSHARNDWDGTRAEWERARAGWEHERADLAAHIGHLEREVGELSSLRGTIDGLRQRELQLLDELASAHAAASRERDAVGQAQAAVYDERAKVAAADQAVQRARDEFVQQLAHVDFTHAAARDAWAAERQQLTSDAGAMKAALDAMREEREAHAHASQGQLAAGGRFSSVVATRAGVVVRANDAFARLLGYADANDFATATAGQPVAGLVLRGEDDAGGSGGAPVRVSFTLDRRGGGLLQGVGAVRRLEDSPGGEPLYEHLVLAISRELDLEDRLRQARRLETVGSLATAMVPELEALIASWLEWSPNPADAQQAAEIVGQLAKFSRHQAAATSTVDLADVVRRMQPLLEQLAGPQHHFRVDLQDAPAVDVSEAEVAQLVTALLVIGRDLLPAGGAIALATRFDDEVGTHVATDAVPMRRPRHAHLAITLRGYGLRSFVASDGLDALVARASGTLTTETPAPRVLVATVTLPGGR